LLHIFVKFRDAYCLSDNNVLNEQHSLPRTLPVAGALMRVAGQSSVDGAGGGLMATRDRKLVGNSADA